MHGDDDVRIHQLDELANTGQLHGEYLADGHEQEIDALDPVDDLLRGHASQVAAVADADAVHLEQVHRVQPPAGPVLLVMEGRQSLYPEALLGERPVLREEILVGALHDPENVVVVMVMGHEDDVRRDGGGSDADGFPIMGVYHDLHIGVLEFEAGMSMPPDAHARVFQTIADKLSVRVVTASSSMFIYRPFRFQAHEENSGPCRRQG